MKRPYRHQIQLNHTILEDNSMPPVKKVARFRPTRVQQQTILMCEDGSLQKPVESVDNSPEGGAVL